jgi:hypothetical protein
VEETVPIKKFERDIANILQLYALEAQRHVVLPTGYAAALISDEKPFGEIPPKEFRSKVRIEHPSRIVGESSSALRYALRAYKSLKNIFEDSSKLFLRHGLKYYHMALGEEDIQRKIIDLFVALEALFSSGLAQEIRFRTSLRIATFFKPHRVRQKRGI